MIVFFSNPLTHSLSLSYLYLSTLYNILTQTWRCTEAEITRNKYGSMNKNTLTPMYISVHTYIHIGFLFNKTVQQLHESQIKMVIAQFESKMSNDKSYNNEDDDNYDDNNSCII